MSDHESYDWKEGVRAALFGNSAYNPNQSGSNQYKDWQDGYDFAEKVRFIINELKP